MQYLIGKHLRIRFTIAQRLETKQRRIGKVISISLISVPYTATALWNGAVDWGWCATARQKSTLADRTYDLDLDRNAGDFGWRLCASSRLPSEIDFHAIPLIERDKSDANYLSYAPKQFGHAAFRSTCRLQ